MTVVNPGCTRWAIVLVVIAIIIVLITTATVVMASAVIQTPAEPQISVQPRSVAPGEVVLVTGKGWPAAQRSLLVVALSPNRDWGGAQLTAVSAAPIEPDGTMAATFVFPGTVPWTTLSEAWIVVRPPVGAIQAVARVFIQRRAPTPTPTVCFAATPMAGSPQLQGTVVRFMPEQSLLVLRPADGTGDRGVSLRSATLRFSDGRAATVADLRVGLVILAQGWFDGGGTLLAEQIIILQGTAAAAGAPIAISAPQPTVCLPVCTPQPLVCLPVCTPTCAPTAICCPTFPPIPATACPPAATPTLCVPSACPIPATPYSASRVVCPAPVGLDLPACPQTLCPTPQAIPGRCDYWKVQFFARPDLSGEPALVREDEVIDFAPVLGPPSKALPAYGYSVRWLGPWRFDRTCRYRFRIVLNGGVRLAVDGRVILDHWGCTAPAEYQAEADLAAGAHVIELTFIATRPKPRVQLRWEYADAAP